MKVHPDLAESYEQSKDGLTWTFKLRKGVKFQNIAPVNGREFTSADVANAPSTASRPCRECRRI